MKQFWDALRDSIITQATVTIALTGAVIYLGCTQQPIPELIAYGFSTAMGFFFGSKVTQAIMRKS